MLSKEQKEEMLNQVLDLMTAIAYDEPADVSTHVTTAKPEPKKVEMLTIKESAELISGLSEHTVRQLVKHGRIKSVRTGAGRKGKILVNKADLIAYFQK